MKFVLALSAVLPAALVTGMAHAEIKTSPDGKVVTFVAPPGPAQIDYANAKPKPLPRTTMPTAPQWQMIRDAAQVTFDGPATVSEGGEGDGGLTPETVPQSRYLPPKDDTVGPQEFGSSGQPYTTSRVNAAPHRRAGKLFFKIDGNTFVCTASLIKPGIIVTAAHCVASFGARRYHSDWTYIPAYADGAAPFGKWSTTSARVLASYFNGTDSCAVAGVVCKDDVAVLTAKPKAGKYPGAQTGFFGFATGGYSYSAGQVLISQLGYPVALDNGSRMERTDSQGSVTTAAFSKNTIIGSLQTGGSSGGPWVANLGNPPKLTSGTEFATDAMHNIVVGVTSWGYTDTSSSGRKQQGASPFTAANIKTLVDAACAETPAAC